MAVSFRASYLPRYPPGKTQEYSSFMTIIQILKLDAEEVGQGQPIAIAG